MKLINSTKLVPEGLAIKAIRRFSPTNPSEVVVNNENQYFACWDGSQNQELWLEISKKGNTSWWSITIGQSFRSVESVYRSYFTCKNPVKEFINSINLFISHTEFTF